MSSGTMKNAIRAIVILNLILLVAGTQLMSSANASTLNVQRRYSFLKASGTSIVDSTGNAVLLRGANFFGYEYGLWSTHTEADYQRMASWGFNVVRLPIAWNFIEPQPGQYDGRYFANYVDRDVAWARKNGLYIILDMHQYAWSPRFTYYEHPPWTAGIPVWAQSAYPDTAEGEARAKADFWSNLGPNGATVSDTNPSMQDRFMLAWEYVANRYKDENAIAAYDLFNEPDGTRCNIHDQNICYYDYARFPDTVSAFLTRVVDAIRIVDSNHMILWEPGDWDTARLATHVDRPNVVYSPHYPGWEFIHLDSYNGDKTRLESCLLANVQVSQSWNQPMFVGEWGITVEAANATQYVRDLADLQNKYPVSWTWWTYGKDDFGMTLLDGGGTVRTALTQYLVNPTTRP